MRVLSILLLVIFISGCIHKPIISVDYPFQNNLNITTIRNELISLDENHSLMLTQVRDDEYNKIYKLDHLSKKLKLVYDFGRNISKIFTDKKNEKIYFYVDLFGDENNQIYLLNVKTQKAELIFGHHGAKAKVLDFSLDSNFIFISSNFEKRQHSIVYLYNVNKRTLMPLTKGSYDFEYGVADIHNKYLVLTSAKDLSSNTMYLFNLKTKSLSRVLTSSSGVFIPRFFHPEENTLYLDSNTRSDLMGCYKVHLDNPHKLIKVFSSRNKNLSCRYSYSSNISFIYEAMDGKQLIRPYKEVFLREYLLPPIDSNYISSIVPIKGKGDAILSVGSYSMMPNLFKFNLYLGDDSRLTQISNFNHSKYSLLDKAIAQDYYFTSGGTKNKIHSLMIGKEKWFSKDTPHPVLVYLHKGAGALADYQFNHLINSFVHNNYIVLALNYSGSINKGKSFAKNKKGIGQVEQEVKDLISLVSGQPYINGQKIYALGEEYGANVIAQLISKNSSRFVSSVLINPVFDSKFYLNKINKASKKADFKNQYLINQKHFKLKKILANVSSPLYLIYFENNQPSEVRTHDKVVSFLQKRNSEVRTFTVRKSGSSGDNHFNYNYFLDKVIYSFNNIR